MFRQFGFAPLVPGVVRERLWRVVSDIVNKTAHMRAKNVVLSIGPGGGVVGGEVVVGLHEGLLCRLPVCRELFLHVQANTPIGERKLRKVLG